MRHERSLLPRWYGLSHSGAGRRTADSARSRIRGRGCWLHPDHGALELSEALAIAEHESIVAAILDVSLSHGETCAPVARTLAERGVPYVLHTGDLDRMDEAVRKLGGVLVPKPTPAAVVVSRALEGVTQRQQA